MVACPCRRNRIGSGHHGSGFKIAHTRKALGLRPWIWRQPVATQAMLAPPPSTADIVRGEIGGGQVPRQPGQVRKEAAVTSSDLGRPFGLPLPDHGSCL